MVSRSTIHSLIVMTMVLMNVSSVNASELQHWSQSWSPGKSYFISRVFNTCIRPKIKHRQYPWHSQL